MIKRFLLLAVTCFLLSFSPALADEDHAQLENMIPEVWTAESAVRFALQNSPDIRISRQRIEAANAAISIQKASFYPSLSFVSEYSQTNNAMYSFGNILNQGAFDQAIDFNDPGRTDNFNGGVRLSYRLYNGGRDQAGLEAAEAQAAAVQIELRIVHDRLAFEVVRAFNLIRQAEEMVKAHETMVEAIDASLAVAQARYGEGDLLRSDLLDLEVQLAGARENVIQARNGLELSHQLLLNLLGLQDQQVLIIPLEEEDQHIPQNRDHGQRPELRSLEAMIEAARARLRQAGSGYYPVVDGYAGYGVDNGFITGDSGNSWQAGIKLQYNLSDGQRTESEVARAAALLAEAEERRRKADLAIGLEIKQADLALADAEERLTVTEKTVGQAEESARINRERFSEGVILSADLIAVENRMTDARIRRNIAQTQYRIAVAELRRALGLPQFETFVATTVENIR